MSSERCGGADTAALIRIITFSTLYPNSESPNHGVFVENRLRQLVAGGRVQSRVVAPVPWFPSSAPVFGRYAATARVPRFEVRNGLRVAHPRYLVIPKVGMVLSPYSLFAGALPFMRRLRDEADFDLIDAHYFYPDGVAAAMLGHALGKPVTITARGTDINYIPRYTLPRKQILSVAQQVSGLIAVSQALKAEMAALGIPPDRITVLRNGVDLQTFRPGDRTTARRELGLTGRTLLSVGHLIPRKGHDLIISALPRLEGYTLLIAGEGPEKTALHALAERLGVAGSVWFLGSLPHSDLPRIYSAADALVLASSREGWPNVLLEAMACGTPVIASPIWGNPEVVSRPEAGVLMTDRTADSVVEAVERLFRQLPTRESTRHFAEGFSWDATTAGQIALFEKVLAERNQTSARLSGTCL